MILKQASRNRGFLTFWTEITAVFTPRDTPGAHLGTSRTVNTLTTLGPGAGERHHY